MISCSQNLTNMNWINSWKTGNKKNKINLTIRIGVFTLLELKSCAFCSDSKCCKDNFRFIIFNFGFEI